MALVLCLLNAALLPAAAPPQPAPRDRYDDPLPSGCLARLGSVRLRHKDSVLSVTFSPDGKLLASSGNDYTTRVWDRTTGKELHRFGAEPLWSSRPAARAVNRVAFSPDGKRIVSGSDEGILRLWELATEKQLLTFSGHQGPVTCAAFAPNGKILASGSADQTIRLWDPASGKQIRQSPGNEPISCLAFAADGKFLVTGGEDGNLRIWPLQLDKPQRVIEASNGAIHAIAITRDRKWLASAGLEGIKLWDLSPGNDPGRTPFLWSGIPLGYSPGLRLGQSLHWLARSTERRRLVAGAVPVKALEFSPDGTLLVSGGHDQALRFWEVATGKERFAAKTRLGAVLAISFTADGQTVACGDADGTIRLWEVTTAKQIRLAGGHEARVNTVAFAADGKKIVTAGGDQTMRFWDTTGQELRPSLSLAENAWSFGRSPDGKIAAVGNLDGTIQLLKVEAGREVRRFKAHQGTTLAVAFSPDGKLLASGGEDKAVHLWEVASGKEVRACGGNEAGAPLLAFSPDGRVLASAGREETIHLLDPATGGEIRRLSESGAEVLCFCFSSDSNVLAAGSRDGILRLWEVGTGKILRQFEDKAGAIRAVEFSADGKSLAVGGWSTVRLLEVATGQERARWNKLDGDVLCLAFAPDARSLAAGTGGTTVLLLNLTSQSRQGNGVELTAQELEKLWNDLAARDAGRAHSALWSLVAGSGRSVPFLRERLRPVPALDEEQHKRAVQWIAALDSDDFPQREKANQELEKLGETAEPVLRKALAGQPTTETRARLAQLLARLQDSNLGQDRLRASRAVEALERIGIPEAQEILKALARGAPEAALTVDAGKALDRATRQRATGS